MAGRRLRVGRIGYLNVLPIYYPLEQGTIKHDFSFVYGSPAELNELIKTGRLDISVVSSIEYALRSDRYLILPDLSISCRGHVKSVLLFSRYEIHQLDRSPIHVTPQSHASVALLKILTRNAFGLECTFVKSLRPLWQTGAGGLSSEKLPESYLAIGDEALYWWKKNIYPRVYDLGKLWWDWTGLPFVFALWVCRREIAEKRADEIERSVAVFHEAKRWGWLNRVKIVRESAMTTFLTESDLHSYFDQLHYDLDEEQIGGLRHYFALLNENGLISSNPEIEIFSQGREACICT
ncbi:menaquinone biosynthetic enzyme MqnA/MqnD family protein [Thermodesulforhabdus norvegica]|uniref:Chorismate dehydratase n=1 Tax=Thermodesulforhabdus norvegica TaxID=39841 RepID=A0A1I4UMZ3_9BACT|nr:menaquinone biosynthesis protein [Thermodesulforhabdus norvegica]SFM90100.1 chorismate dehydratase [Thermodesulforhabdus norvegica]